MQVVDVQDQRPPVRRSWPAARAARRRPAAAAPAGRATRRRAAGPPATASTRLRTGKTRASGAMSRGSRASASSRRQAAQIVGSGQSIRRRAPCRRPTPARSSGPARRPRLAAPGQVGEEAMDQGALARARPAVDEGGGRPPPPGRLERLAPGPPGAPRGRAKGRPCGAGAAGGRDRLPGVATQPPEHLLPGRPVLRRPAEQVHAERVRGRPGGRRTMRGGMGRVGHLLVGHAPRAASR